MTNESWIKSDESFVEGLSVLEHVENSKLRLLVNRICQTLKFGDNDNIFNQEEEEKLLMTLGLEQSDYTLLLKTIVSLYSQATFYSVKPHAVESTLKDLSSISDDKIAILSHAWITYSERIIESHMLKSIFPCTVKNISWSVDVKTCSSAQAKEAKPVAKLQLNTDGYQKSQIIVEMNKPQMLDLNQTLRNIQAKLESLKK